MADGLMSQAIANVRRTEREVAAVAGLPPAAVPIQSHMIATLESTVPKVQAAASAVLQYAADAAQPLAAAEAAIEAGDSGAMKNALESVRTSMGSSMSTVRAAISDVKGALDAITADNQALANVGTDLNGQITRAEAQAGAAQSAADELESKKYYWLLLGPFGLIGLGVCIGMMVTATEKVNGIRQHVSELRGQAAQWKKVQADLELLRHDVPTLTYTLLSLQSSLDFLAGDTTEVVADVGKAGAGSHIARAYMIAANHQLAMLRNDAA